MKKVDFDDFGFYWGEYVSKLSGDINNYEVAKYFYELGIKSQTKDMIEALRTEYEKGRADVIAKACQFLHDYQEYPDHDIATDKLVEAFKMYIEL